MIVQRIFDAEQIKSIMTRPDVWKTVAEDGLKVCEFIPNVAEWCYLLIIDDGAEIGVYQLKPLNGVCLEIHATIFPEHRGAKAFKSGRLVLDWIYDNAPKYQKVVVQVPMVYKNVRLFAKRLGFSDEGINRASYAKNGIIIDQWHLGITRQEIGEDKCPAQ